MRTHQTRRAVGVAVARQRRGDVRLMNRRTVLWLGAGGATLLGGGAAAVLLSAGRADSGAGPAAGRADLDADTVVVDRPQIDLGRVPLEAVVPVSVTLTNLSRQAIIFGTATAQALEGC